MNASDLLISFILFAAAGVAVFQLPEPTGWVAGGSLGLLSWLWLVVRSPG